MSTQRRFTPWSVWFADLNPVEGHEQGGDRLVVVVNSPDGLSINRGTLVTVIPVTRTRRGLPWHVDTELGGVAGAAMPEQIRTIAISRIRRPYDGELTPAQVAQIQLVLRRLLAI